MLEEHWQKECLAPNSLLESGLLSIFERNVESLLQTLTSSCSWACSLAAHPEQSCVAVVHPVCPHTSDIGC